MPTISVQENLDRIELGLENFKKELESIENRRKEIKDEMLRLEGCLITFSGFKHAGIESIRPDNENKPSCGRSEETENSEKVNNHCHDMGEGGESRTEWVKEFHHIR